LRYGQQEINLANPVLGKPWCATTPAFDSGGADRPSTLLRSFSKRPGSQTALPGRGRSHGYISRSPVITSGSKLTNPSNASGRSAPTASIQTALNSLNGYLSSYPLIGPIGPNMMRPKSMARCISSRADLCGPVTSSPSRSIASMPTICTARLSGFAHPDDRAWRPGTVSTRKWRWGHSSGKVRLLGAIAPVCGPIRRSRDIIPEHRQ
jgi:hypothetical protein